MKSLVRVIAILWVAVAVVYGQSDVKSFDGMRCINKHTLNHNNVSYSLPYYPPRDNLEKQTTNYEIRFLHTKISKTTMPRSTPLYRKDKPNYACLKQPI